PPAPLSRRSPVDGTRRSTDRVPMPGFPRRSAGSFCSKTSTPISSSQTRPACSVPPWLSACRERWRSNLAGPIRTSDGPTYSNFLIHLQAADDEGRALSYVSAVAMEEKQIWDYNQGNPRGDPKDLGKHPPPTVPLVAIYPREGTLAADHPYAVLNAPWVTAAKRQAAEAFLQFLERPEIQARFQA